MEVCPTDIIFAPAEHIWLLVTDPVTGMTFEIAIYRQFLQMVYHVRLAWGVAAIKPDHIALLQG